MNYFAKSTEPLSAGDAGVNDFGHREEDPFRTIDDLMAVVEALCPVWPERDAFVNGGRMLL